MNDLFNPMLLWWVLLIVCVFLAYLGLVLPALPDMPLLLIAMAIYHFTINDTNLGWGFWVTVTLLTLMMIVVDYVASGIAAKKQGGSYWSLGAAVLGVLTFPWILGPLGVLVGPFVLVVLVEYIQKKDIEQAFKVGYYTLIGFLGGVLLKFIVMTTVLVWFLFKVYGI